MLKERNVVQCGPGPGKGSRENKRVLKGWELVREGFIEESEPEKYSEGLTGGQKEF